MRQNEIYYSLSTRVIVTPGVILSRCLVLGVTNKPTFRMDTTPSKRKTKSRPASPRKRPNICHVSGSDSDTEELAEEGIEDPEKVYHCKFAIDSRRGIFYTFNWERHRKDALAKSMPPSIGAGPSSQKVHPQWEEGRHWDIEEEKLSTRKTQKSRHHDVFVSDTNAQDEYQDHYASTDLDEVEDGEASESDQGAPDESDDDNSYLHTPSKKRTRDKSSTTTPRTRKRTKTLAEVTPHSKVALAKRRKRTLIPTTSPKRKSLMAFPVRYPAQSLGFQASMAHIPKNPWLRSMHALHVGSRPNALPCREGEYARVLKCVGELLEEGSGGCICRFIYFFLFHR